MRRYRSREHAHASWPIPSPPTAPKPMPLTWNEIRTRAASFVHEWRDESREHAEANTFWNQFLDVFGVSRRRVATFEEAVKKRDGGQGFIDLFWPGVMLAEHKSRGKSLDDAYRQAVDYLPNIGEADLPRYVVVSDFARMRLHDLETGDETEFALGDLLDHVAEFGFIAGYEKRTYEEQDPVNVEAAVQMGALHDALRDAGYQGHDLEVMLVRLLFCLFADDTGIFTPRGAFQDFVATRTPAGRRRTSARCSRAVRRPRHPALGPADERWTRSWTAVPLRQRGPVLGDAPAGRLRFCDAGPAPTGVQARLGRDHLRPSSGSLFQSVMDPEERRELGAHYTLGDEHPQAHRPAVPRRDGGRAGAVRDEQGAAAGLPRPARRVPAPRPRVRVRQLPRRGVPGAPASGDRGDRAATKGPAGAERERPGACGRGPVLRDRGRGVPGPDRADGPVARGPPDEPGGGGGLRGVLHAAPADEHGPTCCTGMRSRPTGGARGDEEQPDHFDVILGNPPFVGRRFRRRTRNETSWPVMRGVKAAGRLDFVTAWYVKAAQYMKDHPTTRSAFVSTNSISQGEQVGILWNELFTGYGARIHFAHRTFRWDNEATGRAAVHVVIVGFGLVERSPKLLFDYDTPTSEPHERSVSNINPYLVEGDDLVILKRRDPLADVPPMRSGNKPTDGGAFIFVTGAERDAFLAAEPGAAPYVHPYVGSEEYINGDPRYCLWLAGVRPLRPAGTPPRDRSGSRRSVSRAWTVPLSRRSGQLPLPPCSSTSHSRTRSTWRCPRHRRRTGTTSRWGSSRPT